MAVRMMGVKFLKSVARFSVYIKKVDIGWSR